MISDETRILLHTRTQELEKLEVEYETLDRNNYIKVLALHERFSPLHDCALRAFETQKIAEQVRSSFQDYATKSGEEFSASKESDDIEKVWIALANRVMKFAAKLDVDVNRHREAKTQAERVPRPAPAAARSNEPDVSFMPKGWLANKKDWYY